MSEHIDMRVLENGSREFRLPVALGAPQAVFSGFHPGTINYEVPLQTAAGDPLLLSLPADWREHYFCLAFPAGRHISAARDLPLEGAANFRDFGGYRTADGRRVRWGMLFRSGHLSRLSEADREYLGALDIRLVCDLRREEEMQAQPPRLPDENPPQLVALPISPGSATSFFVGLQKSKQSGSALRREMEQFMCEVNQDLALGQQQSYSALFRQLHQQRAGGVLINCTAGKDRTGFAAAIILLSLGVPRETVMEDYLLSRHHMPALLESMRWLERYRDRWGDFDLEILRPMLEVHTSYLQTALSAIDENFASLEEYLEQVLGVDAAMRTELQRRFLED